MNKCLSVLKECKDLGSRVAVLEGRQHNNNTSTKARADSAHCTQKRERGCSRRKQLKQSPEEEQNRRCTGKRTWCNNAISDEGWMGQPTDPSSIGKPAPHVKRMPRRRRRRTCSRSNSGIASGGNNGSRTEDELRTSLWQKRKRPRSGPRPGQGVNNASRTTYNEWKTLPVGTLVRRRLLSMTLKQLEIRCTSNTVHFVLNEEHYKDAYWPAHVGVLAST